MVFVKVKKRKRKRGERRKRGKEGERAVKDEVNKQEIIEDKRIDSSF